MPPPADKYRLTGKILVVDDVEENRTLMEYYLKRAGAQVTLAEDGKAALESLRGNHGYSLVLMDMQMPEVDGYTAVRSLRDQGFMTPIIAVTAHTLTGDREKCLLSGCDEYVAKPINPDTLLEKCETLQLRARAA